MDLRFLLLLDLSLIAPPSFTCQLRLSLFFQPLISSHLTREWSDYPPGRCPRTLASTTPLRFPHMPAVLRISSRDPVTGFPFPVAPPLTSLNCAQVPVSLRVTPVRGSLPPSACLHHLHPCSHLRPRPATQSPAGTEWLALCSSAPPIPCAFASLPKKSYFTCTLQAKYILASMDELV